jgi:hypothetical protein
MSADFARHTCRFARQLEWGTWLRVADGFLEREARRVFRCVECGLDRPNRKPRPPGWMERERQALLVVPDSRPEGEAVAARLLREASRSGSAEVSGKRLLGLLRADGVPGSLAEEWLDRLLSAGWIRVQFRLRGSRRVVAHIDVKDREAIEDFAHPGQRDARLAALARARETVRDLAHPIAEHVATLLDDDGACALGPDLLRALAAVAAHAASGETLAERVFSARYLGDSKALRKLRRRLEHHVGPLEAIGIREGAAITLLGGAGRLHAGPSIVEIGAFAPYLGLAREVLTEGLAGVDFPEQGLFVVENLTVFEACCRGEVAAARGSLVIWSAGYPGRGVRALVERAATVGAMVRAWADLDLDGVRIARLLARWAGPSFAAHRMSPDDVASADVVRPLSPLSAAAIRADLRANPGAVLAETLAALLERDGWIEQETMLAR